MTYHLKNKWQKYVMLKKCKGTAQYVPLTRKYSQRALNQMLQKYSVLILKPWFGKDGLGIIKITRLPQNGFIIHHRKTSKKLHNTKQLYQSIKRIRENKAYMIQQYIPLAEINHCPVDFRVIVQRKMKSNQWFVTGKIAKKAGRGFFITNISVSRGKLITIHKALRMLNTTRSVQDLDKELSLLAIRAAKRLQAFYPNHRIYGMDLGIDKQGKAWIIEANVFPHLSHFVQLKDKSMYRQIIKFKHS